MTTAETKTDAIQAAVSRYDINLATIAQLHEKYMCLRTNGPDDEEAYQTVRRARLDMKAKRVQLDKTRRELNREALDWQRGVNGVAKEYLAKMTPIEEHLIEQERLVTDAIAEAKAAEARRREEKFQARWDSLSQVGALASPAEVRDMDEETFVEYLERATIKHVRRERERREAEQQRERERKELDAERERIRKEREMLLAKEEEERRAMEERRAERERQEAEAAEAHAAKMRAEEERIQAEREAVRARERELEEKKRQADKEAFERAEKERAKAKAISDASKKRKSDIERDRVTLDRLLRHMHDNELSHISLDYLQQLAARMERHTCPKNWF